MYKIIGVVVVFLLAWIGLQSFNNNQEIQRKMASVPVPQIYRETMVCQIVEKHASVLINNQWIEVVLVNYDGRVIALKHKIDKDRLEKASHVLVIGYDGTIGAKDVAPIVSGK